MSQKIQAIVDEYVRTHYEPGTALRTPPTGTSSIPVRVSNS